MELITGPQRDLALIRTRIREYSPLRADAVKRRHPGKMATCLDVVANHCERFPRCWPPYFRETTVLAPYFAALEACNALPRISDNDNLRFVLAGEAALTALASAIDRLLC